MVTTEDPEDITKIVEHFSDYAGRNMKRNVFIKNKTVMPKWGDLLTNFIPFSIEIVNESRAKLTIHE